MMTMMIIAAWLLFSQILLSSYVCGNKASLEIVNSLSNEFETTMEAMQGDIAGVSVSTRCWRSAMAWIQSSDNAEAFFHYTSLLHTEDSAAAFCATMPEPLRQRLTLAITECQMKDFGKPLFENSAIEACTAPNGVAGRASYCLQHMTSAGQQAYTQFSLYVQILCVRQTQELLILHQRQVQENITISYATISRQSILQMESLQRTMKWHTEQLLELPGQVREAISKDIRDLLDKTFESIAAEQTKFFTLIMNDVEFRDIENKARFIEYLQNHTSQLDYQRITLERLNDIVSKANRHLKSIFGLEALLQAAYHGYSWFTFVLFFLGSFNAAYFLCKGFRSRMCALVVAEAILEMALTSAVWFNMLLQTDVDFAVPELRRWAVIIEATVYVVSIFMRPPAPPSQIVPTHETVSSLFDEINHLKRDYRRLMQSLQQQQRIAPDEVYSDFDPWVQSQNQSRPYRLNQDDEGAAIVTRSRGKRTVPK